MPGITRRIMACERGTGEAFGMAPIDPVTGGEPRHRYAIDMLPVEG